MQDREAVTSAVNDDVAEAAWVVLAQAEPQGQHTQTTLPEKLDHATRSGLHLDLGLEPEPASRSSSIHMSTFP